MGEPNANSTITLRMTRLARRRKAGQVTPQQRGQLLADLRNAATAAPDIGAGPLAGGPGGIYGAGYPARSARERHHLRNHVPPEIGRMSKAVIAEVVDRDWPASYFVAGGPHWMVELVTMRDPTMGAGSDAIEAAVKWVNPEGHIDTRPDRPPP